MEYLTVKEFAELMNIHPDTVRRWCKDNKLEHVKIGREYRILNRLVVKEND